MGEELVGEVYIAIPSPAETVDMVDKEAKRLQFTGRPFRKRFGLLEDNKSLKGEESNNREGGDRWVSGILRMATMWAVDENGNSLGPDINHATKYGNNEGGLSVDPIQRVGPPGLLSLRKLMV